MTPVLIDTNAYAAFKQGLPDAVAVAQQAPKIILSSIVLGELLAGFAVGSREAQNHSELQQFLASPRVVVAAADERTSTRACARKVDRYPQTICGLRRRLSSTAAPSSVSTGTFAMSTG
jgi:predicted nucleic acid-binding protein